MPARIDPAVPWPKEGVPIAGKGDAPAAIDNRGVGPVVGLNTGVDIVGDSRGPTGEVVPPLSSQQITTKLLLRNSISIENNQYHELVT